MSDFNDETAKNSPFKCKADTGSWQLYGTVGCHLCEIAESLLQQAQAVSDIRWHNIDIAALPEAQMLALADKIPVLVTPTRTLYYPFSIMDIMALTQ